MGADITFVNQGNQIDLQSIKAYYYAPIREFDLESEFPNYEEMNSFELNQVLNETFDNVKDKNGNKIDFWSKKGEGFFLRDGETDVYTKEGLTYEIFEYLNRQVGDNGLWRIKTNVSDIDFKNGGKILIGNKEYKILKIVNAFIEGTVMQKFLSMDTPDNFDRYAIKIMALIG